jgi:hypothetical protein
MKNRKGADKLISVYWFAILFIVAAAIVYMVLSFYGEPYDARKLEANALTNQVADCLSEAGYLKEGILERMETNLLEACDLNFEVEEYKQWNDDQFYLEIRVYDFDTGEQKSEISEGNQNLKIDCEIDSKNFPFCLDRKFYVIDKNESQYQVNILSIVRKTEKNAQ